MRLSLGRRSLSRSREARRRARFRASPVAILVALLLLVGCAKEDTTESGTPGPGESTPGPAMPLLRIEPAVANVVAGQRVWVEARLADGYELEGVAFEITFDPRYVRVEDSVPDAAGVQIRVDALCDSPLNVRQDVITNEVDNEEGVIRFESSWSLSNYLCADALVASIDIRGVAEGGCPLRFAASDVVHQGGEPSAVERPGNGLVLVAVAEGTPQAGTEAESTGEAPSSSPGGEGVYHTVQTGETLSGIATKYGTTVDTIVEANSLQDPDAVGVGQRLLIPAGDGPAEAPQESPGDAVDDEGMYTIQTGDTLSSIAARFGTTVEALAELNDLDPPYSIVAGDRLRLP